ncbi:YcfL family protein [Motilimonas pumila]|uniref:DUF1425 domain-containing protein n=1 Tax=Motilimonas pumila TaxID=2303987 RepID=A0A418YBT5_9GAMM|nr:YcfL family protein [Motilimonas pumila]RJG41986.1 DUF1425 domain-containing protein [Motilimonas pumila]
MNTKTMIRWSGALIVALLSISGCSQKKSSGIGAQSAPAGTEFVVDNPDLAAKLQLSNVMQKRENNFLVVQAQLASLYDFEQKLQYQFRWFDEAGFQVEKDKSAWRALKLHGKQTVTLQSTAPTKKAQHFTIYVREILDK